MSPRLSDSAGDSLLSRDRRDRHGSSARLGGPRSLLPLGSSSPGAAAAAGMGRVTQGWHQPWQLAGNGARGARRCHRSPSPLAEVREGGPGWERPGHAPSSRKCSQPKENLPAAPKISHLSRLHPAKAALSCSLWTRCLRSGKPHRKFT